MEIQSACSWRPCGANLALVCRRPIVTPAASARGAFGPQPLALGRHHCARGAFCVRGRAHPSHLWCPDTLDDNKHYPPRGRRARKALLAHPLHPFSRHYMAATPRIHPNLIAAATAWRRPEPSAVRTVTLSRNHQRPPPVARHGILCRTAPQILSHPTEILAEPSTCSWTCPLLTQCSLKSALS